MDPSFGGDELEREAEPEGGAEEVAGREMREAAGGEEDADDGADGGDGEADGERAEHPFAVLGNLAAADMEKGLHKREENQGGKKQSGRCLVEASDGHGEAHPDGGEADDETGSHEDAARPAMKAQMARADVFGKLQRTENHEKKAGNDVHQS